MLEYDFTTRTSREEPVSVLDDRLNDADDLQGHGGHHFCHVPVEINDPFDLNTSYTEVKSH